MLYELKTKNMHIKRIDGEVLWNYYMKHYFNL